MIGYYLCRPLHSSPHEYFIFKVKTSWIHMNNMIFAHIHKHTHIVFLLKVVLAGAFYPNYFTWKISDEELSLRQMSGLDPTTTVMVNLCCMASIVVLIMHCCNSCQGYHHTPTNTEHCYARCLVLMEKERRFILMAPGSVCA